MNINGQGHSLTLIQGHSDSTFSNCFSLETASPIEAKFHVDPPCDGVMKVSTNGLSYDQDGRQLKPNFMWSLHGMGEWLFK